MLSFLFGKRYNLYNKICVVAVYETLISKCRVGYYIVYYKACDYGHSIYDMNKPMKRFQSRKYLVIKLSAMFSELSTDFVVQLNLPIMLIDTFVTSFIAIICCTKISVMFSL